MSKNKNKNSKAQPNNSQIQLSNAVNPASDNNQNQSHNTKKESLGKNTKG